MMTNIVTSIENIEETIFISYARKDGLHFAEKLHDDLENVGLKVWLDIHNIEPGTDWNMAIDVALDCVDVVLVILTPGAVESLQVKSEWNYALDKKKLVIPILIKDCEIPRRLRVINYIDLTKSIYKTVIASLLDRVQSSNQSTIDESLATNLNPNNFYGFYAKRVILIGIWLCCFVTGVIYELLSAKPQTFIGVQMLLLATLILMVGIRNIYRYLINNIVVFFAYVHSTSDVSYIAKMTKDFYNSLYSFRNLTISGVIYGLILSGAIVYLTEYWKDDIGLAISLMVFIFFINFPTGLIVYWLFHLFRMILKTGMTVEFDFWERNNPSTKFILNIASRCAIFVCLYTSLCINSVYFLEIPLHLAVHFYALFAGFVALSAYVIPTIPLRRRFIIIKNKLLTKIDKDLTLFYNKLIEDKNTDVKEGEQLNALKQKVDKIEIWPYSITSLLVISLVIFITLSPIFIAILL